MQLIGGKSQLVKEPVHRIQLLLDRAVVIVLHQRDPGFDPGTRLAAIRLLHFFQNTLVNNQAAGNRDGSE